MHDGSTIPLATPAAFVAERLAPLHAAFQHGHLHEMVDGLGEVADALRKASDTGWPAFVAALRAEPAFAASQQDPFTSHAFRKPRGYPGDALLLDYIYRDWSLLAPPPPASLGERLYRWTCAHGAPTAVRWRRRHLAELIDEAAQRRAKPRVLAVACGHLREATLSVALRRGEVGEVVALDQDPESLAEVGRQAKRHGWPVTLLERPIRRLITGRCELGEFDLVYAAGLYDYLATPMAQRLTRVLFGLLRPGGRLVVANFTPETAGRGYMEAFMDWWLTYRRLDEVLALDTEVDPAEVVRRHAYLCPTGNVAYLALRKAG